MNAEVTFESCTDTNSVGPLHNENQDSVFASKTDLLFAIADGVGGYQGAKEASEIATRVINDHSQSLKSEESLRSCVIEIDKKIKERARQLRYAGMGTTLALAKLLPEKKMILTANVGDSPILLVSDDVTVLYSDDSMRFEEPNNMWAINQYLGCEEVRLNVHTQLSDYKRGDVLLLCSDGVSDNILGTTRNFSILGTAVKNLMHARGLVEKAIDTGRKRDDMSAVLVFL